MMHGDPAGEQALPLRETLREATLPALLTLL
jgi:hypothetical protein